MKIEWSAQASADLAELRAYLAEDSAETANRITLLILETIERALAKFPESGHYGRIVGTRELVIPKTPVIVPYRVHAKTLEILRVYHHSRRWPDQL